MAENPLDKKIRHLHNVCIFKMNGMEVYMKKRTAPTTGASLLLSPIRTNRKLSLFLLIYNTYHL